MFEQVHRRCMTHKLRAEVTLSWLDVVVHPVANMKVQLLTFRHLIETLVTPIVASLKDFRHQQQ